MNQIPFKTAAVIGTGMMGPGIAAILALGGVETTILSRAQTSADKGLQAARDGIATLLAEGITTAEKAGWALAHLSASADTGAVIPSVDLVIESAPEDMEFKKDLFAHLDEIARPECVLASNTSGLSITEIQSKCARPERVITTHFWNPPQFMPLVEIVKGERTADEVAQTLRAFLTHCGKVAVIVKKDTPGQLGNRLQSALIREAIHIVAEGIADAEDVDLAVKNGFGLRLPVYGVFEHMDAVGFELASAVADYVSRDLSNYVGVQPIVREMAARGETGAAAGKGWYDYSVKSIDEVKRRRNEFLLHMLKRSQSTAAHG
jgi:3-hydroxybutyryl-CoA dehydrogenase